MDTASPAIEKYVDFTFLCCIESIGLTHSLEDYYLNYKPIKYKSESIEPIFL